MDRLVWLLCIVGHDALLAEPAGESPEAETRSSEVAVLEPGTQSGVDGASYVKAIQDHGTSSGIEVVGFPPRAQAPLRTALERIRATPVLGVFWFVIKPDSISIFLLHARTQGVYVRELPREPAGDAALVEMVGLIVASTAVALRDGQDVQMRTATAAEVALLPEGPAPASEAAEGEADVEVEAEAEAEADLEPEPEPQPAAREVSRSKSLPAAVQLGYLGEAFNTQAPWQSGVAAGLGVRFGERWQVGARYGWLAASAVDADDGLKVARHGVGLGARIDAFVGERARLAAQLGAEVEIQRWRLDQRSGSRVRGRLGPGVVLAVDLGAGVGLEATVEGVVALNRFSFVRCASEEGACEGAERTELGQAWRIAPRALLGLTYRFALSPREESKKKSPGPRLGLL